MRTPRTAAVSTRTARPRPALLAPTALAARSARRFPDRGRTRIGAQRQIALQKGHSAAALVVCQVTGSAENPISSSPAERVIPWLLENGATPADPKVVVEDLESGRGRGLVAAHRVEGGEVLLSVPFTHVFMEEDDPSRRHWSSVMAMRLLHILSSAQGSQPEPLAEWAESLPSRIDTPPIQFSPEELQATGDPDTVAEAEGMGAVHEESYQGVLDELEGLGVGRVEYDWAVSVLHSRCFCMQPDSLHITVPGIDMANHSFQPTAGVRVKHSPSNCQGLSAAEDVCEPEPAEPSRFELVALEEGIGEGEEVTISYGSWPNDLFYLLFGFVPADNPHDSVVLFSTVEDILLLVDRLAKANGGPSWEEDRLEQEVDSALSRCALDLEGFQRLVVAQEGFDGRLFPAVQASIEVHPCLDLDPGYVVLSRLQEVLGNLDWASQTAMAATPTDNLRTATAYREGKRAVVVNALAAMGYQAEE